MKKMTLLSVLALMFVGLLAVRAQNSTAPANPEVIIQNFAFQPKELKIKVGTTVKFTNKDGVGHTATADDKSFDTGMLGQNQSKEIKFAKAGTFKYHCGPHPSMTATIIVTN